MTSKVLISPMHLKILEVNGAITSNDGAHLTWLASQVPDGGTIVEIGSFEGRSACFLASGLAVVGNLDARIYCIDLWSLGGQKIKKHQDPTIINRFQENTKRLGADKWIKAYEAESTFVARTWSKPIDLLFIDGDHSYEGVSRDYRAWQHFIPVGGWIAFHDNVPVWPGVMRLIDEVVSEDRWSEWYAIDRITSARRIK